jgi:mRNA interferase RelE/StbE
VSYSIALTDLAKEMLGEISDKRIRANIGKRIDKLTTDAVLLGKPLKGKLAGFRSARAVAQRFRIVYEIREEQKLVVVVGIGIRKEGDKADVYSRLARLLGR